MNASRTQTPALLLVAIATIILGLSAIFDGVRTSKRLAALEARLAAIEKAAIVNASLIIKQDAQGNQVWNWSPPTNTPAPKPSVP